MLGVVLSSDLRAFEIQNVRGFSYTGVAFRLLSRLLKTQHRRTATLLLLLVGCKQALLPARGRAGRVFRTCGVGVGGAFVARCVCVCATARESPTNVRRAFCLKKKMFAGCYAFVAKSKICAASGTLDDASACLPWAVPQSVLQEPDTLFGRVLECCGRRLVCLGCPVEDDVCLDVLVSWLPGRLYIFLCGILLCFFPLANWPITLHEPSYYFLYFSPPHRPNYDSKALLQVAYEPE